MQTFESGNYPLRSDRWFRFDKQTVPGARLEDLDPRLWGRFRTRLASDDDPTFLQRLGAPEPDHEGIVRPTVAGARVLSRRPHRWIPKAWIEVVA